MSFQCRFYNNMIQWIVSFEEIFATVLRTVERNNYGFYEFFSDYLINRNCHISFYLILI